MKALAYEILKVKNHMASEIFPQKDNSYSFRNSTALQGRSIKTVMYGSETISSLGQKRWDILPKKRKFVNGTQRIVHVVYIKCTYKTLDFCKLPVRTYFVL